MDKMKVMAALMEITEMIDVLCAMRSKGFKHRNQVGIETWIVQHLMDWGCITSDDLESSILAKSQACGMDGASLIDEAQKRWVEKV